MHTTLALSLVFTASWQWQFRGANPPTRLQRFVWQYRDVSSPALDDVTDQVRGLTAERMQVESQVSAGVDATTQQALNVPQQALQLPKRPRVRVPQVGRDVPDIPLNLRNATPQRLPRGGSSPARVPPVNLPKLPLLPF